MPLIVEKIFIPVYVTGVRGQPGYEAGVQDNETLSSPVNPLYMPLIVEQIVILVCVPGVGGQPGYEAGVQEDENLSYPM